MALGEIGTLEYGKPLKDIKRNGGNYPVMGSNGIVGYHDCFIVEGPCIVVGRKGSAGAITWVYDNCYPIDTAFYIKLSTQEIELRFLYHFLMKIGLSQEKQTSGVPGLNRNDAYIKKIPVPPLAEQKRIAAVLDKFEALVNDISCGLPAEIKMRRLQYEYYRNKLLTFNKTRSNK
jgi:restriction endonuclease S subunit